MIEHLIKNLSAVAFCLIITVNASGQEINEKFFLSTGFGYFDPERTGEKGNLFYSKLLIKTNSDLYLGFGFESSLLFNRHKELQGYEDVRFYENMYLYNMIVEKHLELNNNKNVIVLGTGLIYEQIKSSEPRLNTTTDINGQVVTVLEFSVKDNKQHNAGTFFELGYNRQVNRISIGFRTKAHFLLDIGYSGLIISPSVSIKL